MGVILFNLNKTFAMSNSFQHVVPRGSAAKASWSDLQNAWTQKPLRLGLSCVTKPSK